MRGGVRVLAAGLVVSFLGLVVVSTAAAQSGGALANWSGHWSVDMSCTAGPCVSPTATETLDLVQIGKQIIGTLTGASGDKSAVTGAVAQASKGAVKGASKTASLETPTEVLMLYMDTKSSLSGTWQGDDGTSGSVAGVPAPSALIPTWTGVWPTVVTCSSSTACEGSDQGSLLLNQAGNALTAVATDSGGVTTAGTGTVNGLSATITFSSSPFTATFDLTMSPDGKTFTGDDTAQETGTGNVATFPGNITGTRDTVGPSLAVVVSANVPQVGLGIRKSTDATVVVTALGGAVNGISLGSGLVVSSELEVTSSPSDLSGFSLADGQSKALVFTIKGVEAGLASASAHATGSDAGGTEVDGSAVAVVKVGGPQLTMIVSADPPCVSTRVLKRIGNTIGPPHPHETVTVTVRNVGDEPANGVRLISLVPVPADHTLDLKKLGFPAASFPASLGTLAPGKEVEQTFHLDVDGGRGSYQVEGLGLFDDASAQGGNGRMFATSGAFEVSPRICSTSH